MGTTNANKALASVLNGNGTHWSNGPASVVYHERGDYWTWITPDGTGMSDWYGEVLEAVTPYLTH